uniref:Carboxylic ester hydrolase n=1 Tax=Sesamia inferens TaxID=492764 RepID=A0A076FRM4_SESIF|nr:odorant degrading enzyme CXE11 [Sesamia inferens]
MTEQLVVETEQGKIRGEVLKTSEDFEYCIFKGIPYAKPPVGELRFCIPQPPDSWDGIRDGTKDCNTCAQFDRAENVITGDEDCLYLNVYTPKSFTSGESLPVMVFLHGGGFVFGNGTDISAHGPDYLIRNKVVIVSINYRLGILGFLALNLKGAPGNMGLRDQVQALKWVQKNIVNFGGDPKSVTIFGISAGAASVEYLLLSPMAKGLFHKAIAQSGSSLLHWAHTDSQSICSLASKIPMLHGETVRNNDQLLEYLKKMSTKDLIADSMKVLSDIKPRGGLYYGFVPTVEAPADWEPFLSKPPYELLTKGEFHKVPYITGFCSREGLIMISHKKVILDKFLQQKVFTDYFPFHLTGSESTIIEQRLKRNYLEAEKLYPDQDAYAIDFFSDVDFIGGIYVAATLMAKHNAPIFMYEFSYDGGFNYIKKCFDIKLQGACHGDDGGYIAKSNKLTGPFTDLDRAVRNTMNQMWVNFAGCGDPTPRVDSLVTTKWEPTTDTKLACLVIDQSCSMKYEVYPQRMTLFEEMYKNKGRTMDVVVSTSP